MFEPMSARLASSCSRNGIRAVAADTIWKGGDVDVVDVDGRDVLDLATLDAHEHKLVGEGGALLVEGGVGLGDDVLVLVEDR